MGGWHYPYAYYNQLKKQSVPDGWEIDFYVVSHRDPELPIVFDEKQSILKERGDGTLQAFDKELYSRIITKEELSQAKLNEEHSKKIALREQKLAQDAINAIKSAETESVNPAPLL